MGGAPRSKGTAVSLGESSRVRQPSLACAEAEFAAILGLAVLILSEYFSLPPLPLLSSMFLFFSLYYIFPCPIFLNPRARLLAVRTLFPTFHTPVPLLFVCVLAPIPELPRVHNLPLRLCCPSPMHTMYHPVVSLVLLRLF